jgi:hypothetical protein
MFISVITLLLLSCQDASQTDLPELHTKTREKTTTSKNTSVSKNQDNGNQKHPPIPENNPIWEWDAKNFVPDFGWFGEHSWMDVRMRIVGHISAAGRDLVRYHVQQGDFVQAQKEAENLISILQKTPKKDAGVSTEIHNILLEGFVRDAKWIQSISQQNPDFSPIATTSFSKLREEYYRLALAHEKNPSQNMSEEAKDLQQKLLIHVQKRDDLDLLNFDNFVDRHKLRVRLFEAYIDSLDPLIVQERWGYWEAIEIQRQAILIGWALEYLGGTSWKEHIKNHNPKSTVLTSSIPKDVFVSSPVLWPSLLGEYLRSPDQIPQASAEEFGRLPTGDSLIDIAGHPGPKGIGTLEKLGLNDPSHNAWLIEQGERVLKNLSEPSKATKICEQATQKLNAYTHGSRFYNVKQFRNACVRQLALAGSFTESYLLLQQNFPLHNQDWACPNRKGILEAIGGRLLVLDSNPDAVETLETSIQTSLDFLQKVSLAEKGKLREPKPPSMGEKGTVPGFVPNRQQNTSQPRHNVPSGQVPHFQSPKQRANPSRQ